MMPIQCVTCQHFIVPDPAQDKITCKAFPDGIPTEILTSEVDHDHVVEGQARRFVWTEKPRAARQHRTWFVVKCDVCGETFFFSRPRRSWTRFTIPKDHLAGTPCGFRNLRILHYRERLKALKAAGKI